jgi:dynein heavy chain
MHENANISFQQQESDKILEVVLSIQPRESGGGGGKSPEEIVSEMAQDQTERVPAALTDEGAHADAFALDENTGLMLSLGTSLSQEMARFNGLLVVIRKTLNELQKAIKGTIVMTCELYAMFGAMQNNQVPAVWTKAAYPCLKPLSSWFPDMILRVEFLRDWIEQGIPTGFWINAFFFPQGFLTAVLQGYSRKNQVPVDVLGFEFVVQDYDDPAEIEFAPDEGMLIYGFFMDACRWDYEEMVVAEQEFGVMYVQAPVVHFAVCQNYKPDPDQYSCPLYKTSVRAGTLSTTGHSTNFVLPIEVDTAERPSHWILKGAAFLCMLND